MLQDPVLGTTCCILDGLDECDEDPLEVILKRIKTVFAARPDDIPAFHLNMIITSRNRPEFISEILVGKYTLTHVRCLCYQRAFVP